MGKITKIRALDGRLSTNARLDEQTRLYTCDLITLTSPFRWTLWACVLGMAAAALAGFSLNDGPIPINKNLWSLSFILATGAMAFFLLTLLYLVIDVYKFWGGAPLIYPGKLLLSTCFLSRVDYCISGMNSILLYLGHEICSGMFPWSWRPYTQVSWLKRWEKKLLMVNLTRVMRSCLQWTCGVVVYGCSLATYSTGTNLDLAKRWSLHCS